VSQTTASLQLRQPRPEDLDGYRALFCDREVERWLRIPPEPPFSEPDVFARLAEDRWHWQEHGFGPWALIERDSSELVGRAGLKHQMVDGVREVELGWAVRSDRWGRGYATESAEAGIEWARELGIVELVALIMESNTASRRVAEKLGMKEAGVTMHAGFDHLVYRLATTGELSRS
jgi:RimJ/RimL family protein N-acetyltransferase